MGGLEYGIPTTPRYLSLSLRYRALSRRVGLGGSHPDSLTREERKDFCHGPPYHSLISLKARPIVGLGVTNQLLLGSPPYSFPRSLHFHGGGEGRSLRRYKAAAVMHHLLQRPLVLLLYVRPSFPPSGSYTELEFFSQIDR